MTFADYLRRKGVQVVVTPMRVMAYTAYAFGCVTGTGVLYRIVAGAFGIPSVLGIAYGLIYIGVGGMVAAVAILAVYRAVKGN